LVQGDHRRKYMLKPLVELFGKGGSGTVNPRDEKYLPLFLSIEEVVALFDEDEYRLTDGEVLLDYNTLASHPEAPSDKQLIQRIQVRLRLTLSLNDYSRQEVRQAFRRLCKSVELHSANVRGYLNFIKEFLPGIGKKRR
jgi:hypothetical protein